jgi:hypothetical protein
MIAALPSNFRPEILPKYIAGRGGIFFVAGMSQPKYVGFGFSPFSVIVTAIDTSD